MKNKFFGLVLPAIVLAFAFVGTGCKNVTEPEKGKTTVSLSDGTAGDNKVTLTLRGTTWINTPWTEAGQKDLKDWFIYTDTNSDRTYTSYNLGIIARAERISDTVLTVTFTTSAEPADNYTVVIKPGQSGNMYGLGSKTEFFKDTDGRLTTAPALGANAPVRISIPKNPAQTPSITVQPQGAGYHPGALPGAISVMANVTDGGKLSYQWYKNTENSTAGAIAIDGEIAASYMPAIPASVTSDVVTYYYAEIINTKNGVTTGITSNIAAITVTNSIIVDAQAPVVTVQQLDGASYTAGGTPQALTVTASSIDGGTLSYQWFRNTVNSTTEGAPTAVGSNSPSLMPSTTDSVGTFYYYVVVTNTNARANGTKTQTATSDTAEVTVTGVPLSGIVTISGDAVEGRILTADTTALGGIGAITYKWTHGDSETALGTNGAYYRISAADKGKTIKVTVTRALCTGEKTSAETAVVIKPVITSGNTITARSVANAEEVETALSAYLRSASGGGSAANPVVIKLNVTWSQLACFWPTSSYSGEYDVIGVLFKTTGKYVSYDLSDSNLTYIQGSSLRGTYYNYNSRGYPDWLVSVILPNDLTSIGKNAFYGCSSLTSVTIPSNVETIGDGAFKGCSSLSSITIPDSVTSIGSSTGKYDTVDGAFEGCSKLTSVTIGNGVKSIGNSTFSGCSSLALVTIPDSVTAIGKWSFYGCSNLRSVTIGSGVTSIGGAAFYKCNRLRVVDIRGNGTSLGSDVFKSECYGYNDIVIIPGLIIHVADSVLSNYRTATNWVDYADRIIGSSGITVAGNVITAGSSATSAQVEFFLSKYLAGASGGDSATNPVVVKLNITSSSQLTYSPVDYGGKDAIGVLFAAANTAGKYVSYDMSGSTIDSIKDSGLNTVRESAGVSSFRCLSDLYSANEIYLAHDEIDASKLVSITLPNTLTSIGNYAFYNCSNLTSVIIPSNVESIGYGAFGGCKSLTSVIIPSGVTTIGDYAFRNCSSLASVTIENGVKSIGYGAFGGCSSLASVTMRSSTPPTLGRYALGYIPASFTIKVPSALMPEYTTNNTESGWAEYKARVEAE